MAISCVCTPDDTPHSAPVPHVLPVWHWSVFQRNPVPNWQKLPTNRSWWVCCRQNCSKRLPGPTGQKAGKPAWQLTAKPVPLPLSNGPHSNPYSPSSGRAPNNPSVFVSGCRYFVYIQKGFQATIYVCILDAQIQQRDTK